jgi:ribosomal protein L29
MAKKTSPVAGKEKGELLKMLTEKREELRAFRFASAGARPKDSTMGAKIRRDIARILTELAAGTKVSK